MAMGTDERQRLHHSHCTSTICLFFFFFAFFFFPLKFFLQCTHVPGNSFATVSASREIRLLLQGQRPILLTNLTRACQTSASDPWHPSIGCKLPTLAQEPLPEVTGRSYGQFCPPGVQAALGKSCLSLYSRTLKLLKSVLMDAASPAVLIVLCTGNHCPPGALVEHRLPRARQAHSPQV